VAWIEDDAAQDRKREGAIAAGGEGDGKTAPRDRSACKSPAAESFHPGVRRRSGADGLSVDLEVSDKT